MVISKNYAPPGQLFVIQQPIKQSANYSALSRNLDDQWEHYNEIKVRIEKARAVSVKI